AMLASPAPPALFSRRRRKLCLLPRHPRQLVPTIDIVHDPCFLSSPSPWWGGIKGGGLLRVDPDSRPEMPPVGLARYIKQILAVPHLMRDLKLVDVNQQYSSARVAKGPLKPAQNAHNAKHYTLAAKQSQTTAIFPLCYHTRGYIHRGLKRCVHPWRTSARGREIVIRFAPTTWR
ncbi:MAG: hypothetical protein ACJAZW_002608, partial [Maritalea sp.]